MLTDVIKNFVVLGGNPFAFSATLDDVEAYLKGEGEQAA